MLQLLSPWNTQLREITWRVLKGTCCLHPACVDVCCLLIAAPKRQCPSGTHIQPCYPVLHLLVCSVVRDSQITEASKDRFAEASQLIFISEVIGQSPRTGQDLVLPATFKGLQSTRSNSLKESKVQETLRSVTPLILYTCFVVAFFSHFSGTSNPNSV